MNIDIYIVTNISVNVKPASRYHGPTSNISRHRDPRLDGLYQTRYTWPNEVRLPKPKKLPAVFYQTPAVMSRSGTGSSAWTKGAVASTEITS